jgi:homocysteine S-methyltransferase
LLGSSINHVHDLLLITGDPPKLGNSRDATPVYDIDSIGLTYLVNRLNHGLSPQGDSLGSQTEFGIGVASNPTAINIELELSRWKYKVESGADFAFTQPIYEPDTFLRWKDMTGSTYKPHVIGIWPFISYKNAEFMAHEVPGVHVPTWALEKMSKVQDDPLKSVKTGIEIAAQTIKKLWNECEGFAISAPLGRVEVALEVLKCLE